MRSSGPRPVLTIKGEPITPSTTAVGEGARISHISLELRHPGPGFPAAQNRDPGFESRDPDLENRDTGPVEKPCVFVQSGFLKMEYCNIMSHEGVGVLISGGSSGGQFDHCGLSNCGNAGIQVCARVCIHM
jgi:hypothetical protein